jgi:RNA polymerase sigma-70 factor (ECF subfamily)
MMIESPIAPDQIIREYGTLVSSICRRMIQDEDTAKDAAQEVWIEVVKSLPSFQGKSKLSTWIYTIAYRVVMNFTRQERQYSTTFLHDYFRGGEREIPEKRHEDKEEWVKEMCDKCLTGMLHCLDNETRMAYIFREMAHLSYADIAHILEKDETAVRKSVSRSRRKLRNFLNNECVLFNPAGRCRCRMKRWVQEIRLPEAYQKLRTTVHRINIMQESERVLPRKNYWEQEL